MIGAFQLFGKLLKGFYSRAFTTKGVPDTKEDGTEKQGARHTKLIKRKTEYIGLQQTCSSLRNTYRAQPYKEI